MTVRSRGVELEAYMGRVAELGCAVCRRLGVGKTPAVLHHPRQGTGGGRKAPDEDVVPLCPEHHDGATGVHGLGVKRFCREYGFTEWELREDVRALIGEPPPRPERVSRAAKIVKGRVKSKRWAAGRKMPSRPFARR